MASDLRRPGTSPGIEAVLRERFHVPPLPSIGREEAARRALAAVEAQGKRCERIEVSDQPVARGALFDMAGARVRFPEGRAFDRCYVALVDPEPATRWGHPAHWAFVPADGEGDVVLQETLLPESSAGPVRLLSVELDESAP